MDDHTIKEMWEETAKQMQVDLHKSTPTSRDPYLRLLEVNETLKFLSNGESVLDVGCGNGYSTNIFAEHVKEIVGIDYAKGLIAIAKENFGTHVHNLTFEVCSVLDLTKSMGTERFDTAISERCIINLNTWEKQKQAILEIKACLKPNGKFILIEGFTDGLHAINTLRKSLSLDPIKVVDYNLFIDDHSFEKFINEHFTIKYKKKFGAYFFISRVVHPLIVSPQTPQHDSPINKIGLDISNALAHELDHFGYESIYVLEKKENA